MRAGTYLGGPKPPFTPGYELVGIVDERGDGCSRLRVGDRVGALTQWGANAESVCVSEKWAVEVPEDLDPLADEPARLPSPRPSRCARARNSPRALLRITVRLTPRRNDAGWIAWTARVCLA